MKKMLVLFALFVSTFGFSQIKDNWEEKSEILPGYIITNNGEKIDGYLKRFLKIKSQRKVRFYKTKESKATTYRPKQLKAYKIATDYYESHPYEGLRGKTKVFLLRSVVGKINLFEYYIRVEDDQGKEVMLFKKGNKEVSLDFNGTKIQTEILAVKDEKEYLKFTSAKLVFKFKKVMSKYLSDFPALSEKIKTKKKGYRILSILSIVKEYNAHFEK
ncbi:hypothetical protein N9Q68_00425 [Polaribacter sp.]|nr:hypothetical protein [Polaribacter sp.]